MAKVNRWQLYQRWLAHILLWLWSALALPCLEACLKCVQGMWRIFTYSFLWIYNNLLFPGFQGTLKWLGSLIKHLTQNKRSIVVLGFVFILLIGIFWGFVSPITQSFEGSLTISEIGFTCTEPDQLLLRNVQSIKEMTLSGRQTFELEGNFESEAEPRLNSLNRLKVELPEENSQITISAIDSNTLTLAELKLQQNTKVSELRYHELNRALSLSLQPDLKQKSGNPNRLSLDVSAPLKITLENYRLPTLNLQNDSSAPFKFSFITTQLELSLLQPTALRVELSNSDIQPFWKNIAVKDVQLKREDQDISDSGDNSVEESTILAGTVRMAERSLNLEKDQFLMLEPPGTQSLRRLQLVHSKTPEDLELKLSEQTIKVAEPPQGLEVLISGETSSIKVGLNPKIPVASLKSNLLTKFNFSNDVNVAILSSLSTLVITLLFWLVDNFLKSDSKA